MGSRVGWHCPPDFQDRNFPFPPFVGKGVLTQWDSSGQSPVGRCLGALACREAPPVWLEGTVLEQSRGASQSTPTPLAEGLTQDGEACGAGPDGSLDGLALIHSIILQLCPQDLQVMFPRQVVPYHQVLWVTCGDSGHIKGGWGSDGRHIHNRQAQRGDP